MGGSAGSPDRRASREVKPRSAADGPGRDEPPPLRARRLAAIRAAIASGTYETTERLDLAVSRLLAEFDDRS